MKTILTSALLMFCSCLSAQQEQDNSATLSLFTGSSNYHGDLNPNHSRIAHSCFASGLIFRKPINRWFTVRAGAMWGKIKAADRWNRDNLKFRNLSFTSDIKEAHIGLEIALLDISTKRFTPYLFGGFAVFNFNPWTYDNQKVKTFLKPLSTEGQGLSQYPSQKTYKLIQYSLPFGGGLKFAMNDEFRLGIELSQRKTFTDYLDDLSTEYVDVEALLLAKGAKAVELSYRGDELPNGQTFFPDHGVQRGNPEKMDWYYFYGFTMEIKLNTLLDFFKSNKSVSSQRCPYRF